MGDWAKIMRGLSYLSQFGLSLAAPLLICLFVCSWLVRRFSVGAWIFVPGLILGLGASGCTAWKFFRSVMKDANQKHFPTAFNDHR